jgi:D-alanyl-D-alanine carboxypeptidase
MKLKLIANVFSIRDYRSGKISEKQGFSPPSSITVSKYVSYIYGGKLMKKFFCILFAILFAVPVFASEDDGFYTAGSVLVMDAKTAVVLYENEGFARRYPASITKIMTALVVLEEIDDLSQRVIFSENAVTLPDYAGKMGMEEGESLSVLEALYGIMLPSANDIARALAEHVSGSVEAFVAQMNRRAHELGAYDTRFINPCGLPGEGQFTTAYDIALIKREAMRHPLYAEIISTPYFYLPPNEFNEDIREMRNSNVMVRPEHEGFDSRIIGGKTGFTNAAQHTLVSYAAYENREIIISVLFASPRGVIFEDTAALMDYIFSTLPDEPPEEIDEEELAVPVFAEEIFYEPPSPEPEPAIEVQEISATEAITAALSSIVLAAGALLILWRIQKIKAPRP